MFSTNQIIYTVYSIVPNTQPTKNKIMTIKEVIENQVLSFFDCISISSLRRLASILSFFLLKYSVEPGSPLLFFRFVKDGRFFVPSVCREKILLQLSTPTLATYSGVLKVPITRNFV